MTPLTLQFNNISEIVLDRIKIAAQAKGVTFGDGGELKGFGVEGTWAMNTEKSVLYVDVLKKSGLAMFASDKLITQKITELVESAK